MPSAYSVACEVVERTRNAGGCICGGDVLEKLNAVPSEKLHSECDLNICDFKLVENFLATNRCNLGVLAGERESGLTLIQRTMRPESFSTSAKQKTLKANSDFDPESSSPLLLSFLRFVPFPQSPPVQTPHSISLPHFSSISLSSPPILQFLSQSPTKSATFALLVHPQSLRVSFSFYRLHTPTRQSSHS